MNKMRVFVILCTLVLGFPQLLRGTEFPVNKNASFLTDRLTKNDVRYPSFLLVLELLEHRQAKMLVETGTARGGGENFFGEGGSTVIFGDWACQHNAILNTIDISSESIENARTAAQAYNNSINFICSDSILFLKDYDQPIDFLYLDSFDFDFEDPLPSQEHHLKEIEAAYPKLHSNTIVMIDDCDLPHGGKGKLVIEFLLQKGWIIIYKGYQVILTQ